MRCIAIRPTSTASPGDVLLMCRCRSALRLVAALSLCMAASETAAAHPLDELVQSSFVTVHRDSVFLELDLIAGTRVASAFFTFIDRDHNGQIDAAERRAYVSAVQGSLRVGVGGRAVALALDATLWPTDTQLRGGEGMIRLFWHAAMPHAADSDSVVFTLENTHAPVASGYLVNALVDSLTLPIARTTRSWTQQQFALTVVVNAPNGTSQRATASLGGWSRVLPAFVRHGIYHVATGFDHVLFVIALLLAGGRWQRIAGIVTSFTVAHSVTLSLAVLGVIVPPIRAIEAAIAASIVIVGWQAFRVQQHAGTPTCD